MWKHPICCHSYALLIGLRSLLSFTKRQEEDREVTEPLPLHSMTSSLPRHGCLILTLLTLLLVLLWPVSSLDDSLLISSSQGVLVDQDKARLGSAPPNCRNRCNQCAPCTAVQDPAPPSGSRPRDGCSLPIDKYSNYKPLGWKCRCGDRLYNP